MSLCVCKRTDYQGAANEMTYANENTLNAEN